MKNSKKKDTGGAMKLSVWCFVIFLLITALQFVAKTMLPMVGDKNTVSVPIKEV